ncbi:hypothetical protein N9D66_01765 [Candidatus Nanopelagicales bacterium]|nr:hypothetical protein [Candidatus Nanopelagicales bacterium]
MYSGGDTLNGQVVQCDELLIERQFANVAEGLGGERGQILLAKIVDFTRRSAPGLRQRMIEFVPNMSAVATDGEQFTGLLQMR